MFSRCCSISNDAGERESPCVSALSIFRNGKYAARSAARRPPPAGVAPQKNGREEKFPEKQKKFTLFDFFLDKYFVNPYTLETRSGELGSPRKKI
jgi:hypothetical protein